MLFASGGKLLKKLDQNFVGKGYIKYFISHIQKKFLESLKTFFQKGFQEFLTQSN